MNNLIQDISKISTIPQSTLKKLQEKSQLLICNNISQSMLENSDVVQTDIGFGILYISYNDQQIKYRFVPNQKFQQMIKSTIKNKKSPLIVKIQDYLQKKITNAYKDLL